MKKGIIIFMTILLCCTNSIFVHAESDNNPLVIQWLTESEKDALDELKDLPNPYTLYIIGVESTLSKQANGDLLLSGNAYCTETMAKIEILLEFQQLTPDGWYTLTSGKDSDTDVTHLLAAGTLKGVPAGTFRLKVTATATAYNGYKEFSECCGTAYVNS